MALENLEPETRVERLLSGADLEPANRLEYFLKQAGSGGSGSVEYKPVLAETTKSVSLEWVTSFSGGPILEGVNYRVIVNGTTYEPLVGTAGDLGHICLGNTYVDDSVPSGDYPFGIFYKDNRLSAWLETGDSMTMQIDQITEIPVPSGGSGFLVVKATGEVSNIDGYNVISADKTKEEINAACESFTPVFIVYPSVTYSGSNVVDYNYDRHAMRILESYNANRGAYDRFQFDDTLYVFAVGDEEGNYYFSMPQK